MRRKLLYVVILSFISLTIVAQSNTPIQGSGTPNTVPKFSTGTSLGSSTISQDPSSGHTGINTTSPAATLTVGPDTDQAHVAMELNAPNGATYISFIAGYPGFHNFYFGHSGAGFKLTDTTINVPIFNTSGDGRVEFGPAISMTGPNNRLAVSGGIVVDQNDDNADDTYFNLRSGNTPISPDFSLGLQFGMASGEGIASPRSDGAPNLNGLDFYTSFAKRLSITKDGRVGIGTQTPSYPLEVSGMIKASGITFPDGSSLTNALTLPPSGSGNFGIGTSTPSYPLDVVAPFGSGGVYAAFGRNATSDVFDLFSSSSDNSNWIRSGFGDLVFGTNASGVASGATERVRITTAGNVGVGTATPQERLDVNGNLKISGLGASLMFPDGSIQGTAWNGTTLGGDYAEAVDVIGERNAYEPGDVLAINPTGKGSFDKTTHAYSKLVAGVYSTKPGLTGRRTTAPRPNQADEVPMAMLGIVPTKASTENGSIEPGDLLVSSSTPGYAMKGTDEAKLRGAVIGKAIGGLSSGRGTIEVLILLQ